MNRKLANTILRTFIAIWILVSLTILIVLLCGEACLDENLKHVIQVAVSLLCSIWMGVYFFKHSSGTNNKDMK